MSKPAIIAVPARGRGMWIGGVLLTVVLIGFLVGTGSARAQQVIATQPSTPVLPPALEDVETNRMGALPPGQSTPPSSPESSPFQCGPVTLHPHFNDRILYGTGIQTSPGMPQSTVSQAISLGILLGIGNHWTLDYTPTWTWYSNRHFRDTLNHSVAFVGGTTYEDWILGLSQNYVSSSSPLVETGQQTGEETYSTAANASHRFGQQLSVDLDANQTFTFAQQLPTSREWSTMDWLNYAFWPRLQGGIGLGLGYVDESPGIDQTYEQYQARIDWRATDTLSLQVHGGLEDRQFINSGSGDLINPILGASVHYQPAEVTDVSVSIDRTVSASLLTNQVTESMSFNGMLNQRLLGKLYLTVSGGCQLVTYTASASNAFAGRRDEIYTANVKLSTTFLKRGTIDTFYGYSSNTSNRGGFGYSSGQVGIDIGYRY